MPSYNDTIAPEFQGKEAYTKGDKESINKIKSMFTEQTKYKIIILNPGNSITHAPTFFKKSQLPAESVLDTQEFDSGFAAFNNSRTIIDDTIKKHIEKNGFQGGFTVTTMILSKSLDSNDALVQGFIEANVDASSTKYYIAKNPEPSVLQVIENEHIM